MDGDTDGDTSRAYEVACRVAEFTRQPHASPWEGGPLAAADTAALARAVVATLVAEDHGELAELFAAVWAHGFGTGATFEDERP